MSDTSNETSNELNFIVYDARHKEPSFKAIRLLPVEDANSHDQWSAIIGWVNDNGGHAVALGEGYEPAVMQVLTKDGVWKDAIPEYWVVMSAVHAFDVLEDGSFTLEFELM